MDTVRAVPPTPDPQEPAAPTLVLIGLGGAVGTTVAAGIEMIRAGQADTTGLPLADLDAGLAPYERLGVEGFDLDTTPLAKALPVHGVLTERQEDRAADLLGDRTPWPAPTGSHRAVVAEVQERLAGVPGPVVVNVASTEPPVDTGHPARADVDTFEAALDADDPAIRPSMLYAYAAIEAGVPYANFTPSPIVDLPVLAGLAAARGVPVAGKDGKTGQTLLKTVLAPMLRERNLVVDGWYSTNLLGNGDGVTLDDPAALASKIDTKGSVLDELVGYEVDDHVVQICYYRPRGDAKEAWDNVDVLGFLGRPMQLKINFLCRDSVLAAPLVIEIARVLDLARRRGHAGALAELGAFFKAPMSVGGPPDHDARRQMSVLRDWLAA